MVCKRCKENNVIVTSNRESKKHGILWWLFFGWNLGLVLAIFGKKKQVTTAVCQTCGNAWTVK